MNINNYYCEIAQRATCGPGYMHWRAIYGRGSLAVACPLQILCRSALFLATNAVKTNNDIFNIVFIVIIAVNCPFICSAPKTMKHSAIFEKKTLPTGVGYPREITLESKKLRILQTKILLPYYIDTGHRYKGTFTYHSPTLQQRLYNLAGLSYRILLNFCHESSMRSGNCFSHRSISLVLFSGQAIISLTVCFWSIPY